MLQPSALTPTITSHASTTALPEGLERDRLPQHVAIVMDGNGRWARRQGLPRMAGHRQGAKMLKHILRCCKDWGIAALTCYAFSSENWARPAEEVTFLMVLFEQLLRRELADMNQEGVRFTFAGNRAPLPRSLQKRIRDAEVATANNRTVRFTVAINYGSRSELIRACRHLADRACNGVISPHDIDEAAIARQLYTAGIPDPDLLIRTSGEKRLSNFLLWQMAYTELYFSEVLWPDFDRAAFYRALWDYQARDRRYGKLSSEAMTD
ncbi:MAG: isoprenyl transferase [Cyanobacteria bacterium P01_D01_bin.123]